MRVPAAPFQGRTAPSSPPWQAISAPRGSSGGRDCSVDLGDAADGGQRLAAEAERADAEQVVGVVQLAGGVAGEGQRQVVGVDAAAVVDDADQLDAALLDLDVDAACCRRRRSFRAVP